MWIYRVNDKWLLKLQPAASKWPLPSKPATERKLTEQLLSGANTKDEHKGSNTKDERGAWMCRGKG